MKKITPEELLAAGSHFGHKQWRIHPRAKKYIFKIERGASIIDLFKTADELARASEYIYELGKNDKVILVVATKKTARSVVNELCEINKIPYITNKWIGGFLTNFDEITKNVKKMTKLREEKQEGEWNKLPKHEMVKLEKMLIKLERVYKGVELLEKKPDALFIIDAKKEASAVIEARKSGTKTVAITDTNCNPDDVDYPVPANDDATTSVRLITKFIIDSYLEGKSDKKPDNS